MTWLRDDLRVALRRCLHRPGFTLVVILTLAFGLGANTAVFTLVDALILRSLPVERPEELYRLGDTNNCCVNSGLQQGWSLYSFALFEHLRTNAPEFSELAAFQANPFTVGVRPGGGGVPESFPAQFVTGNYFTMFGVKPAAGRLLRPDDDRPAAAPVAVLSYRAWVRYGLDPSVIGTSAVINGLTMTIVGVTDQDFYGDTMRPDPAAVWIPIGQEPAVRGEGSLKSREDQHWLYAIGRLRSGADPQAMGARITIVLQQWLGAQSVFTNEDRRAFPRQQIALAPAGGGVPLMRRQFSSSLTILFLTSAVLLLIACANLANLLLARADRGQAAIRAALGASARRLMRQAMVEGVLLALAGGAAGVLVSLVGTRAIIALAFPGATSVPVTASPSASVLLFAVGVAVLTGVLFTVAPAWAMSRIAPLDALSSVGRSVHQRSFVPRRWLVITQVALSFTMLTSAGLLVSSLNNLEGQRLGFDPADRAIVRVDPPAADQTPDRLAILYERMRERLTRVAGVTAVSYALSSPMDGNNWSSSISIAGRTVDRSKASSWNRIGPDYFDTVGTRVLRGRTIEERDRPGTRPVTVVNEEFVRSYFGTDDPLGATVGVGGPERAGDFEIIGVVEDVKYMNPNQRVRPMMFLSAFQTPAYEDATMRNVMLRSMMLRSLVLKTRPGAANLEPAIRSAIAEVSADVNVSWVRPLSLQVSGNFRIERLLSRLTSLYGGLALLLTALGLYGVTAYSVARRTREIGVRMALGADRSGIMQVVIGGPLFETTAGLAIGLPLAMLVGRAIGSQLYGVGGQNPAVWGVTIAILVLTSILAAVIPARRAASIDPSRALRGE